MTTSPGTSSGRVQQTTVGALTDRHMDRWVTVFDSAENVPVSGWLEGLYTVRGMVVIRLATVLPVEGHMTSTPLPPETPCRVSKHPPADHSP